MGKMRDPDYTMDSACRDSKRWYLEEGGKIAPSPRLIEFCRIRAGKRILDLGCAVGNYCQELARLGFDCVGVDINGAYVEVARKKGIEAYVVKESLPFDDRSFDTVIILETLEHARDPETVLKEARRVARKNILITVPDNTAFDALKKLSLTFEHMLERDHANFFTKGSLEGLLRKHFDRCRVWEAEPVFIHCALPWYFRKPLTFLAMGGVVKPTFYNRLYAECDI
jgi:ubiquinone/menaquinone biosynthesis C-methylase UbiE